MAVPIYGVQQGASITEYQWLNEAGALSDVPQHWLFGGNTETETTLWRDNNAPWWTARQLRACSVVPRMIAACNDTKHPCVQGSFFSQHYVIRTERPLSAFCFRVLSVEVVTNFPLILLQLKKNMDHKNWMGGSFIAPFFIFASSLGNLLFYYCILNRIH